jgi:phosphatidylcholine synthase
MWLMAAWAVLALIVLANDFNVGVPIVVALCAIAAYVIGSHGAIRLIKSFKA